MALETRLDDEPQLENTDADDLGDDEKRAYRARTEDMVVVPETDVDGACTGLYDVYSQSGSSYVVDVTRSRCDCPDMTHNAPEDGCKHVKRAAMMIQETALPAPGEETADYLDLLEATLTSLQRELSKIRDREVVLERLVVPLRETLDE